MLDQIDRNLLERYSDLARTERLLQVRVTPAYERLILEEVKSLGRTGGPLYRVAYPTAERLDLRAPGEVADFVEDRTNMPPGAKEVIVQKYPDRLLFLVTDRCSGHCLYCFRQDLLSNEGSITFEQRLERLLAYLERRPKIQEVILSGGDPLSVTYDQLKKVFEDIRLKTKVRHLRVHTRNAVFAPRVLSKRTCELLASHNVRLVIHVVHPYELHPEAVSALGRATAAGIRCYAQLPFLRGVNDHPVVLTELLCRLDGMRIRPLTLFIPDPVNYSAAYRLPLKRLLGIVREIHLSTPAWANAVRVVLDTPFGKVRVEDIVEWNEPKGVVLFRRGDHVVQYHDFPERLDAPGDLPTLLWRSNTTTNAYGRL